MKSWKEFLIWFVAFVVTDTVFEFIKSLTENGMLNKWTFVLITFITLIVGWVSAFVGAKFLKNTKTEKNRWIVGLIDFVMFWSVWITFDVMNFSLANNMLNEYYFFGIGAVLVFIGWAAGHLEVILPKQKKKIRR